MSAHRTAQHAQPANSAKAAAAWAALTAGQQEALRLVYAADQQAEQDAAASWHETMHAVPARVWRWLDYGWTSGRGPRPPLGKDLDRGRRRGSAAAQELAELQQAGLVQLRYLSSQPPWSTDPEADSVLPDPPDLPAGGSCFVQVQITRAGRAAYRAAHRDQQREVRQQGLLSEGLWRMLAQAHAADHGGRAPSAVSGAWRHLTGHRPPLVQRDTDPGGLRLTEDGHAHYARHWQTYLRLYPQVNALRPDGQPLWPVAATVTLAQLRRDCVRLRELLSALCAQHTLLAAPPPPVSVLATGVTDPLPKPALERRRTGEPPPSPAASPPASAIAAQTAALLERHHAAVVDYLAAHQQAVAAYARAHDPAVRALQQALVDQIDQARDLYRRACVHYVLAATAAVTTTVAVHHAHQPRPRDTHPAVPDPQALQHALDQALTIDPDAVERAVAAWPWRPPAPPATGLPDTDTDLRTAHQRTAPPPADTRQPRQQRRPRRSARAHPAPEPPHPAPALEPEAEQLSRYADALAELAQHGLLTRLLLRDHPTPDPASDRSATGTGSSPRTTHRRR
ncbi:hypothetical protein [Actinomadura kijaniata]|uniref:hypothetical protein n=1 Tax=Actinomadura kijaniata TaxID=46161 RepID=UPI000830EE6B|nr:hypothetical protein [Actinomadura kijaniata]